MVCIASNGRRWRMVVSAAVVEPKQNFRTNFVAGLERHLGADIAAIAIRVIVLDVKLGIGEELYI
jgi:hypothetical protein